MSARSRSKRFLSMEAGNWASVRTGMTKAEGMSDLMEVYIEIIVVNCGS